MHRNVAKLTAAPPSWGCRSRRRGVPRGDPHGRGRPGPSAQVAQIVKSLVFLLDGEPVVALVSGANRLDESRLAAALGGAEVTRADADTVRKATGYPIGGVPPFGHDRRLPTAVDEDLLRFDVVWAAAGTPRDVFPIAPGELVRATGGTVAPLKVV